ncbi:hypothetical protein HK405_013424 [Cladochytrium tenue]|nr:hypothetical protein HK405_013424 [Cladochytrium tenue]
MEVKRLPSLPDTALALVMGRLRHAEAARASLVARAWATAARPHLCARWLFEHSGTARIHHDDEAVVVGCDPAVHRLDLLRTAAFHNISASVALVRHLCISYFVDDPIDLLTFLAGAGASPVTIELRNLMLSSKVVAALAPIVTRVETLSLDDCIFVDEDAFFDLFAGHLVDLRMYDMAVCSAGSLMRIRSTLRRMSLWTHPQAFTCEVLQKFFDTSPPLCQLHWEQDLTSTGLIMSTIRGGRSLVTLRLSVRLDPDICDLFTLLSEFPHLKRLDITLFFGGELQPVPAPARRPDVTILRIKGYSSELAALAAVFCGIESLDLTQYSDSNTSPIEVIRRVLEDAGRPAFTNLRNLKIRSTADNAELSNTDVKELVRACPNLKTLDISLKSPPATLEPLHELRRLRYFNLATNFDLRPELITEAAESLLHTIPDGLGEPPRIVRVFLHNLGRRQLLDTTKILRPWRVTRWPVTANFSNALSWAGERLVAVKTAEDLPRYF